jgi:ABC-type nickel/cobalt efflux system permease component RcnA
MYRILNLGLLGCLAALTLMLMNHQSELFVSLIVAPAIGLIGCALLIIVALASIVRPAREFNGAVSNERSEA